MGRTRIERKHSGTKRPLVGVDRGRQRFVERVKNELRFRTQDRQVWWRMVFSTLREPVPPYGDYFCRENEALRPNNPVSRQPNLETTEA